ncbi:MAG: hypothetical protein POELPBGB_00178 [Bacteroidia bacterium]|nr:hypothetical protein [Bacteroidia bacterium]
MKMKWYKIIFFHVFKRYYKNGMYKNDLPWLTASSIIAVSSSFYVFSFYLLAYYFINGYMPDHLEKRIIIPIGFLIVIPIVIWFVSKKRYLTIYNELRTSHSNHKSSEILSWLFVFGAYLLFVVLTLLRNKN